MSKPRTRTIIYTRISKDKAGDEHGVANQLADCERYAAERGWNVTHRITDNDLSASNGKHRPGFDEVMATVDTGQVDIVLCWAVDRFVRRIADLESVIGRFQATGARLAAVTGDLDLGNDAGRMVARMLSVIAQGEVERKSARQRLAAQEAARNGKRWTGCPRPFGWEDDHLTPRPAEAEAITWAADALLGGATVSAVMREWNARGLVTPQGGKPFTRQSVTTILRNPRLAGLNAYRGEITGPGDWQTVLSEATWRAVAALLEDPARKPPRGVRTLLGGLARCRCGNTVIGTVQATGRHAYRCNPATREGRPGPHCQQVAAPVDDYVDRVIVERLSRPDAVDLITPPATVDAAALRTEAASIRRNLDALAADRALGLVSRSQMLAANEAGDHRLAEITAELTASVSAGPLGPFAAAESARKVWDSLDTSRKRAVIATLAEVTLRPAGRGARTFNPATVDIEWHRG
jgi:DNA invertase Pin-like site-specific DNA recombinase